MYERDLQDLIRGLRSDAAKKNEAKFISEVVEEIRKEIIGKDMDVKGGAICKLTYLDMLGYDMSWASFHVVEVMSSPHFHVKCGGYLAAAQSFNETTDVLMLTTNLLKKDMGSASPPDISIALNCLSQIMTPGLAQDLSTDLTPMLHHSRPLIRKRAVLVLYKMILHDPDSFDRAILKLRERLEDTEVGVVSATVNVLCELARSYPQKCLPLAPYLFNLLTSSSNNWTLIKIVKLFGSLTPYEPRLVKKLQPPLTDLISTTPAISLLYECVHTCIIGNMFQGITGNALARTCVQKLAAFLDDSDQNLKYIALLALVKIVPSHPHLVSEHQRSILASVNDVDISIRIRALDLVGEMVTRDSLQLVVQHLLSHLTGTGSALPSASATHALQQAANKGNLTQPEAPMSSAYRLDVSRRIIQMCSRNMYENIDDFEWYLSVLVDLSYVAGVDIGDEIKDQLLDVCIRVRSVRNFAVRLLTKVVMDNDLIAEGENHNARMLYAAAWVCGEYAGEIERPHEVLHALIRREISTLPDDVVSVCIMAATKVFGYWTSSATADWRDPDAVLPSQSTVEDITEQLAVFGKHPSVEVQERAAMFRQLLQFVKADLLGWKKASDADELDFPKSLRLVQPLSSTYSMNAVAHEAQSNVPIPDGLDLTENIVPLSLYGITQPQAKEKKRKKKRNVPRPDEQREEIQPSATPLKSGADDLEAIPIVNLGDLNLNPFTAQPAPKRVVQRPVVDTGGEMPDSARATPSPRPAPVTPDPPPNAGTATVDSPQAVQVVRSKKKGSKPKRSVNVP